jgi:hypothetical protein
MREPPEGVWVVGQPEGFSTGVPSGSVPSGPTVPGCVGSCGDVGVADAVMMTSQRGLMRKKADRRPKSGATTTHGRGIRARPQEHTAHSATRGGVR